MWVNVRTFMSPAPSPHRRDAHASAPPAPGSGRALLRLVVLSACVGLLWSRVTLVLHELLGHAVTASLFGARVTGYHLFVFAGGRVSYRFPDERPGPRLVTSLGGIALELLVGAVALALARRARRPAVRYALASLAVIDAAHGAVYLARGTHYGYGDGALLARVEPQWVVASTSTPRPQLSTLLKAASPDSVTYLETREFGAICIEFAVDGSLGVNTPFGQDRVPNFGAMEEEPEE